jgi:FKBP-type peptidyl-prolyl cis-trans isomerase FkpA
MKHFILMCLLFCTCNLVLQAQNKKNSSTSKKIIPFSTTASGLQYKIIKDSVGGIYPEKGGFITFWFDLRTNKDSIFINHFSDPTPVGIPTPEVIYKPSIEEGFALLTEGDSAVFLLNADLLYQKTFKRKAPDYIKPESTIKMVVKMGMVYSKKFVDSVIAEQEQAMSAETISEYEIFKQDSIAIQKYLKEKNLSGIATPGGAYVVILKKGLLAKEKLSIGDTIQTTYIGTLLNDGSEFDRSHQGEYFNFRLGYGQVIKGWDEGFQKLKHGDKALILIPSRLAYGSRGAGGAIPPNAPLIFEVEVK